MGRLPFFVRGSQSIVNRSLTCSLSLVAALAQVFPAAFRDHGGNVAVYFEAAAVIVTLVLLGQVLEMGGRSETGAAITALLGMAPKTARLVRETVRKRMSRWTRCRLGRTSASAQEKKSRWTVWSWRGRAA